MKILVIERHESSGDLFESHTIYFGKDEGHYYESDHLTGNKDTQGIRAKSKVQKNGEQTYYGDCCCTGALTKYGVIQKVLGGNGWIEGHVPDITVKDLELGITWTVADYMERHGLTKLNGGIVIGENIYNDIYGEDVNYVARGKIKINNGWIEMLASLRMKYTPEQLKERGITM